MYVHLCHLKHLIFSLLIPVYPTVSVSFKRIGYKKNIWELRENSPKWFEKYICKCSIGSWVDVTHIFKLHLSTKLNHFQPSINFNLTGHTTLSTEVLSSTPPQHTGKFWKLFQNNVCYLIPLFISLNDSFQSERGIRLKNISEIFDNMSCW